MPPNHSLYLYPPLHQVTPVAEEESPCENINICLTPVAVFSPSSTYLQLTTSNLKPKVCACVSVCTSCVIERKGSAFVCRPALFVCYCETNMYRKKHGDRWLLRLSEVCVQHMLVDWCPKCNQHHVTCLQEGTVCLYFDDLFISTCVWELLTVTPLVLPPPSTRSWAVLRLVTP